MPNKIQFIFSYIKINLSLQVGGHIARYSIMGSAKKKTSVNAHSSEELVQKVWEGVRSNNGIMILLQLMMVKTPITDADSIRALACRALAGLARSEKVRQIISKLPMFIDGQIQSLMKDPILQEKRQEHVMFQKYALELMERVSGKAKPTGAEYEISLVSLHRVSCNLRCSLKPLKSLLSSWRIAGLCRVRQIKLVNRTVIKRRGSS